MTDVYANSTSEAAGEISKLVRLRGSLETVSKDKADTAEYKAAIAAYDAALRATVLYMDRVKSGKEPYNYGATPALLFRRSTLSSPTVASSRGRVG
jgi:hypothetical protein